MWGLSGKCLEMMCLASELKDDQGGKKCWCCSKVYRQRAIVAFCPKGPDQVTRLQYACEKAGFIVQQAIVVPSILTEEELKILSG